MRTKLGVVVAGLGLFCLSAPAVAHHSFDTEYDAAKKVTLSGVVKQVAWTNPHMRVFVDVTDAAGKVTTWNMELTSPNSVQRQGWGRNSLLPGEKVTFTAYGGKVVLERGSLVEIKKDGQGTPLFVQGGPEAAASGQGPR